MFAAVNAWAASYSATVALLSLIVSAILALLTFNYVRLTRATFVEIKKQTDHMTKPFIVADCIEISQQKIGELTAISQDATNLHTKWINIVKKTEPDSVGEKGIVALKIKNIGKSDALDCTLYITAKVTPTQKMENENTVGETIRFNIKVPENISPGTEITQAIGWTGCFPQIEYTAYVTYRDVVDNQYQCNKSASIIWRNALLSS